MYINLIIFLMYIQILYFASSSYKDVKMLLKRQKKELNRFDILTFLLKF